MLHQIFFTNDYYKAISSLVTFRGPGVDLLRVMFQHDLDQTLCLQLIKSPPSKRRPDF